MAKAGDGLKTLMELREKIEALHYQALAQAGQDPNLVDGRKMRIEDYGFMVPVLVLQPGQSHKDAFPEIARMAALDVRIIDFIKTLSALVRELQKSETLRRGEVEGL